MNYYGIHTVLSMWYDQKNTQPFQPKLDLNYNGNRTALSTEFDQTNTQPISLN